jgi:hypothetical protein
MSTFDRQAVIDTLSRLVTPGIKLTALADELGARKHEYAELREILFDLVEEGTVHVLTGGAFAIAPRGRDNDPHGKPLPDKPTQKPAPPKKEKTKPPVQQKKSALPWKQRADAPNGRQARQPQVVRGSKPREEYDPETGETRPLGTPHPPGDGPEGEAHTSEDNRIKGRITVHPAGYGFVQTEDGETVFVPAKYRGTSLDGDRVVVDTWPGVRGTEGRVTEVLARGRARLTGILRRAGRAVYLEPDDPRIAADYGRVGIDDAPQGKDGDAVVIEITRYPDAARRELAGKLLKVLGDPEDPRTEIEKILACAIIPIEFPPEAIAQAVGSARSIPRPRATSTTRSASRQARTARACGSPSRTSRTTCGGATPSTRRRRCAASPSTSRIA